MAERVENQQPAPFMVTRLFSHHTTSQLKFLVVLTDNLMSGFKFKKSSCYLKST